jgi:hypothetical protein
MNLIAAQSANHCQRNWSDQAAPPDVVKTLSDIAVNMPTKQNQEFYKLIVSTDQEYNNFVYLHGYDETDKMVMHLPFEDRHKTNRNTQLRAPLLFQWIFDSQAFPAADLKNSIEELHNGVAHLSVGISAGAVSIAANSLGLKTGFCSCLHQQPVKEKLEALLNITVSNVYLTLGIGYPREDLPHNVCVRPDNTLAMQQIYKKNIIVHTL